MRDWCAWFCCVYFCGTRHAEKRCKEYGQAGYFSMTHSRIAEAQKSYESAVSEPKLRIISAKDTAGMYEALANGYLKSAIKETAK